MPSHESKCEAILTIGAHKGAKCPNKAMDNTLFCGCHKRAAIFNKEGVMQQSPRCKKIVHNGIGSTKKKHYARATKSCLLSYGNLIPLFSCGLLSFKFIMDTWVLREFFTFLLTSYLIHRTLNSLGYEIQVQSHAPK